ncbi:MAG: YihY/virulence factor BrkB family protein [Mycobacterium sp.]|nr:YihY/virulence factor BrkB family protein [Mycobacterium sp.]MBV9721290.1 YihY/virulence factor BrkB family protein [Mycobacterium sp.]
MNPVERVARGFDSWQQRHPVVGFPLAVVKKFGDDQAGYQVSLLAYYAFVAVFPLLLTLTAVTGLVLRDHPRLQEKLLKSAFAEFPIIGGQIHEQLGVAAFGHTTLSLIVGILGALYGARGFANALQNTLNTLWAVPKVDRPGFPLNYLRAFAAVLALGLLVVVSAASSTAAALAGSWGFGGLAARIIGLTVGSVLGTGFFLALFRAAAAGQVPTRAMLPAAAISAIGWQLLISAAGVIVAHQLRHAQAIAGFFGVVLGLLAWLALQASVIVYAIEADVVRVKNLWPRSLVQPPLISADKEYYTSALQAETRRPEQHVDVAYRPDDEHAEETGDDETHQ